MCGIAGIFTFSSSSHVSEEELVRLNDAMVHRGPDGVGTWLSKDKRVGLSHRRLAIVDLTDDAKQPMTDADESIQLTYNGEIYNHL